MKRLLFVFFVFGIANQSIAQGVDGKKIFKLIPPIFKKKERATESIDAIKFIPPIIQKGGGVKFTAPQMSNNKANN